MDCEWIIKAPPGRSINLKFLFFDVEGRSRSFRDFKGREGLDGVGWGRGSREDGATPRFVCAAISHLKGKGAYAINQNHKFLTALFSKAINESRLPKRVLSQGMLINILKEKLAIKIRFDDFAPSFPNVNLKGFQIFTLLLL